MKNAKKWILTSIIVVGVVLAIVGLCISYLKSTGAITGLGEKTYYISLFDGDAFTGGDDLAKSCVAFAIMTVVFAGLTLILASLQLLGVMKDNKIKIVVSLLSIVCAIISFVLICVLAKDGSASAGLFGVTIASAKTAPAAGAYLLAIGGIVAGLFGFFPLSKKSKK